MPGDDTGPPREKWDGVPIPPERWGGCHLNRLVDLEEFAVFPGRAPDAIAAVALIWRFSAVTTTLADGTQVDGHRTWACILDMVHAGVIELNGTDHAPIPRLTSAGWRLAAATRRHIASAAGQHNWLGFSAVEHLPRVPTPEQVARSREVHGDAGNYSVEELKIIARDVRKLAESFYWTCFRAGVGTRCHPFIEFNGLMGKYVQLVEEAAAYGLQFPYASDHSGIELPMKEHDAKYLAEKMRCIFGPYFKANPEMAEVFCRILVS